MVMQGILLSLGPDFKIFVSTDCRNSCKVRLYVSLLYSHESSEYQARGLLIFKQSNSNDTAPKTKACVWLVLCNFVGGMPILQSNSGVKQLI